MLNKERNSFERETIVLKAPVLGTFGSKLTFTIGSTYLTFGTIGFIIGGVFAKKPLLNFPSRKLLYTYYLNNMMQKGLQYANYSGGAAFIYCLSGWTIQKVFEEEFIGVNNFTKNILAGGVAGALIKSTLGLKPALVGGIVGMGVIGTAGSLTHYLRKKDIIDIQMRFDD